MGECPSHLMLSRFKTDDLGPVEHERIAAHLATCEACHRLSLGMDANIAEFEADRADRRDALRRAMETNSSRKRFTRLWFAVGAVAAAAALVLVFIGTTHVEAPSQDDDIMLKGAFSMAVTARRGTEQFSVGQGAHLREGDAVRFTVTVDRPGFIAVFAREADGDIAPLYPESDPATNPAPFPLENAGHQTLPGSIVLDDSAGAEWFIAVFSLRPFDRAAVLKAARGEGSVNPDALGKAFTVQSIEVTKGD